MKKLPLRINAFIYTKNKEGIAFLCLKRTPKDGGFWQTVTGTVHDDESFIGTITREIQEECGIDIRDILKIEGPLFDFEWMKGEVKIREFVYAVEVSPCLGITLAPGEHNEHRWCDEKALFETLEKENNVKAARAVLLYLRT